MVHIHKYEIAKRDTQREIKRQIKIDKNTYKQKVEQNMALGDSRQAEQPIKVMMTSVPHKGKRKNNIALKGGEGQDMANNLMFSSLVLKKGLELTLTKSSLI